MAPWSLIEDLLMVGLSMDNVSDDNHEAHNENRNTEHYHDADGHHDNSKINISCCAAKAWNKGSMSLPAKTIKTGHM